MVKDINYIFKSGKYAGYSISEILNVNPKYIEYLLNNGVIKANRKVWIRLNEKLKVKKNKFIK